MWRPNGVRVGQPGEESAEHDEDQRRERDASVELRIATAAKLRDADDHGPDDDPGERPVLQAGLRSPAVTPEPGTGSLR